MPRFAPPWLAAIPRLALFALVALALLLGTGLLFATGLNIVHGGGVDGSTNLSVGLVCALIVWVFVAAFHLRKETLAVPAPDRERFLHDARLLLTEMGYDVQARGPFELSTRPRFQALLFGGGIQIALTKSHARLIGPKVCVELLRNRLRVLSHLGVVQHALRAQHRLSETLIKRAELRLRFKAEDFAEVRTNVIEVLQETADVVCDLHLLAQSDVGIPESTLEFDIKQWLVQKGIETTLHKHFIQLHRPLGNAEDALESAV
jgi:hypothetical protein